MIVHTNLNQLTKFEKAIITIGTFDGVHTGHKEIISQLKSEASRVGGETVIITFDMHPRNVIQQQQHKIKLLNTQEEKIALLKAAGINHLVIVPFTKIFASQSAEDYIKNFLVKYFHPHTIIIGYDHRFGRNREGDYHLLEKMKELYHYQVKEIPEQIWKSNIISSTEIRKAITNGNIETANLLLGYDYFFEGTVAQGNQLGRTIGYPTANIHISESEKLLPAHGVYAVNIAHQNAIYKGMMNIGFRPTINGNKAVIEVHIFDFNQTIYGDMLRIYIRKRLRSEMKFTDLEALRKQLDNDKEQALQ